MLGTTQTLVLVHREKTGEDSEGRPRLTEVSRSTVRGNLFEKSKRELVGGVYTTVSELWARVPADVTITHAGQVIDEQGVTYRVATVSPRRGPFGRIEHVSLGLLRTGA